MERPSWPETWMAMAHSLAKRSYDPRLQVGCVIASNDNRRIIALGYNGNARKLANEPDSLEPGQSGFVHAEVNALINAGQPVYSGNVYLTHSPCLACAKALINAGVQVIWYAEPYRDTRPLEWLEMAGVRVQRLTP
jgi:dCMP deaminase